MEISELHVISSGRVLGTGVSFTCNIYFEYSKQLTGSQFNMSNDSMTSHELQDILH